MNANLEYMGVDKLHALGCTGKGYKAIVYEHTDRSHGTLVTKAMQEAAPDLEIHRQYYGVSGSGGQKLYDYVKANGIKIVNISLASSLDKTDFTQHLLKMKSEGVIVFCAGGNAGADGSKGIGHDSNASIMVGAATVRSDGNLYKDVHSAIDEELDFMSLKPPGLQGTSFASPTLAGISACIMSYMGDVDFDSLYVILMALSVDMEVEGEDDYTGHGLPIIDIAVLDTFMEEDMKLTKFDDVAEGRWSEEAIALVSETGIMNGVSDTEFGVKQPLTREQMAVILKNLHNAGVIDLKK